jgi:hypothetical protein
MVPKSRAHMMSYPTMTGGFPIVLYPCSDPKKDSFNKQGLVVETLAQSINRKHGIYGQEDKTVSLRYNDE